MATTVITGKITDSAGTALSGVTVTAVLRPRPAFETATGTELASVQATTTATDGTYSFTLVRTADITPSESWYEIIERIPDRYNGPVKHIIQVGAVTQSVYASRVLTSPPPPSADDTYLTQSAADARYVLSPGSFGGAGNMKGLRSAADAGVLTSYARIDHAHPAEVSGTAAARAALTGTQLYEGLRFRETDGNRPVYDYRNSTWLKNRDLFTVANAAARTAITTPYEGMTVLEEDTDLEYIYTGSAWVISHTHGQWISWGSLSFTQSNTNMTGSLNYSRYKKEGRTVTLAWQKSFATGTLGVAGNIIFVPNASLPFDPAYTAAQIIGVGSAYGALAGVQYSLVCVFLGTGAANGTTLRFLRSDVAIANYWGADPAAAIANGDAIGGTITYEATT